jgi:outer membrane receptor protein involved in Fe transport
MYVQHEWDWSEALKFSTGLRYSTFSQQGPYTLYKRDDNGNRTDSTSYKRGQSIVTYQGLEPRFTVRYAINDQTSLKASFTRNMQYIHLVSNAGSTLPTDLWVPSTYRVQPQKSWLGALGLFKNFADNMYETSIEGYYKDMRNQIEYREGYTQSLKDPESDFVFGRGWSYGTEFFINKARGKFTGWIGYTLSWTWRKFPFRQNMIVATI